MRALILGSSRDGVSFTHKLFWINMHWGNFEVIHAPDISILSQLYLEDFLSFLACISNQRSKGMFFLHSHFNDPKIPFYGPRTNGEMRKHVFLLGKWWGPLGIFITGLNCPFLISKTHVPCSNIQENNSPW